MFELHWAETARHTYHKLKTSASDAKRYRAVRKTLLLLAENPRHNSLETHEFESLKGPSGEKVFEAYAQQRTPAAYRIFWYYGPGRNAITIIAITPHP